ncbi:MAG: hypothetical protein AAFQ18_00835 [Pseudomonadota bacterium]
MIRTLSIGLLASFGAMVACSPAPSPEPDQAESVSQGGAAPIAPTGLPDVTLVPAQGEDATTASGRTAVTESSSTIDWDAARRDMASGTEESFGTERSVQIQSGDDAPPVPVLLPSGLVRPAGASRPTFRAMDDGYFAKYPGVAYDIVVSGTNQWFSGGAGEREDLIDDLVFTRTMTGAQVALNRYGAAYLVEFECNERSGAEISGCITETEALDVASRLVVTGSR